MFVGLIGAAVEYWHKESSRIWNWRIGERLRLGEISLIWFRSLWCR